jgi:DNA-binding transcriptional LysR family regulator
LTATPDVFSLRQLRAFESAARLESVSAAAREINLSQPGLTQSIHALESRLAVRLFDRRRSGCYLTDLGAVLLPRVRRFFHHLGASLSDPVVGSPFVGRDDAVAAVNRMTGTQMRSLIAIAESPSIEGAARQLAIAQPSLQRTARDLERALKRSLYQRTARGVTTNAQGTELARRFRVAFQEIKYGLEELNAAQGSVISRIAVGNIPHSGERILSAAANALLAAYPTAQVQVVDGHYDALLSDLRAGKVDLLFGVLRRPAWAADVTEELLFENRYVVVAGAHHPLRHPPYDARPITLRDLANYDWITPGPDTPRRHAFTRMFADLPRQPRVAIETTSLAIYRSALAGSDRLALMSHLVAQSGENAALAVLPFHSPHLARADGIASRADWHPTKVHLRFIELLRAEAARLQPA